MRWLRAVVNLGVVVTALGASLALGAGPAAASVNYCGTPDYYHSFYGQKWNASFGYLSTGLRAPVQLRTNSSVCVPPAGYEKDEASNWIGFEPGSQTAVVQLGYIKLIDDASIGTVKTCRFWGTGAGNVHAYHCGDETAGDQVWFQITSQTKDGANGLYYYLQDCGTSGGYNNCVTKDISQPTWSDGLGFANSEVSYSCQDKMAGSYTSAAHVGGNTYPIKGQTDGGPWAIRSFNPYTYHPCSNSYHSNVSDQTLETWDERNN